ncbi:MAG: helix-turn-helix domain-containing protein [Catenulispora sp.]|nr:helix-turn-helix domain-containing protein [Catenulispora sp.]
MAVRLAQVADLPVVLDVPSAGRLLGIGRTRAYRLAHRGGFPCRVIRIGGSWRVPTADLLALLGLPASSVAAGLGAAGPEAPIGENPAAGRPVLRRPDRLYRAR